MNRSTLLQSVRERSWFYEFDLPDGSTTVSYLPPGVAAIHATRLAMLWQALAPIASDGFARLTAVDIACHQGFFASHLARKGCRDVLAVDARREHLADTELIARAYGLANLRTQQADINALDPRALGTFDIALMFGLLYHVENPVGLLRLARALTAHVCVIETQVTPNMTGVVDWGSYLFQRPIVGSVSIIDETAETHAPEASTTGIGLCPSYEALVWLLGKVGFARVERIPPPAGAYEQLASGKRVMVAAYVS
jgi:tRNA (mo5U34)-methyltransferase